MPNLKSVLQIVVEIDGGEATRTQTGLHQNRLPMLKHRWRYGSLKILPPPEMGPFRGGGGEG